MVNHGRFAIALRGELPPLVLVHQLNNSSEAVGLVASILSHVELLLICASHEGTPQVRLNPVSVEEKLAHIVEFLRSPHLELGRVEHRE